MDAQVPSAINELLDLILHEAAVHPDAGGYHTDASALPTWPRLKPWRDIVVLAQQIRLANHG